MCVPVCLSAPPPPPLSASLSLCGCAVAATLVPFALLYRWRPFAESFGALNMLAPWTAQLTNFLTETFPFPRPVFPVSVFISLTPRRFSSTRVTGVSLAGRSAGGHELRSSAGWCVDRSSVRRGDESLLRVLRFGVDLGGAVRRSAAGANARGRWRRHPPRGLLGTRRAQLPVRACNAGVAA